jgi:hypothetical protein
MELFRRPPLAVLIAWLSACLTLAGCANAPLKDGVYPLQPRERVALSGNTTLTYDSFSDSRCPPNARWIWAGRLSFQFVLDGPGGHEEFALGPDQLVATPKSLQGARVALDPASIPPARGTYTTRPGDVIPVTLRISKP